MEKAKQNWFKTILRGNKLFELIGKNKTASRNNLNLARAMSFLMILLLSATLVCAGNVTMQAGDFDIDGNLDVGNNVTIAGTSLTVNSKEVCLSDGTNCQITSDSTMGTSGKYLYNDTDYHYFNETELNSTIDIRGVGTSVDSSEIVDGTIVDADISDSTNLTLGQKITFGLGEIIDNIVDGIVKITGDLEVTGNITTTKDIDISGYYYGDGSRLTGISSGGMDYTNLAMTNQSNTFGAFDQTFDTDTMFVDAVNNRLGIGDATPGSKLELYDNTAGQKAAYFRQASATGYGVKIRPGANTGYYALSIVDSGDTIARHQFFGDGKVVLANGAGNVGIGTTSPGNKLSVLTNTNYKGISLVDSSQELFSVVKENNVGYLNLKNAGVTKIQLYPGWKAYFLDTNVGIGTTSPTHELNVVGDVNVTGEVYAGTGFTSGGSAGLSQGLSSLVIDERMNGTQLQKKTIALSFVGGILTVAGTPSDWTDTTDVSCPSGFTSVEIGGRQLGCMQDTEEGSNSYWLALEDCWDTYGAVFPNTNEWYLAMDRYSLTDEIDDYEWTSDFAYVTDQSHGMMGDGNITELHISLDITSHAYRCWIGR